MNTQVLNVLVYRGGPLCVNVAAGSILSFLKICVKDKSLNYVDIREMGLRIVRDRAKRCFVLVDRNIPGETRTVIKGLRA